MKIVLVTETYPPEVNGVAMTNQRLVRGLLAKGYEIVLVKPRRTWKESAEKGLAVETVRGLPIPRYPGLRFGLPCTRRVAKIIDAHRPAVVHVATEGPLGWASLRAARSRSVPVTSTFHTNFQDYCADYGAAFLQSLTLRYLRWFHNRCSVTTVPDPRLMDRLGSAGLERLEMLGRGADTVLFSPERRDRALRKEWGAEDGDPVAVYVGRAAAEKNIPLALEAGAEARKKCPNLRMVVVGDGPVRRKLAKKWPDVHFAGMRYDEDLARHYASADLFLFGSESETFGNVVVEAMASGLAVLTYDYAAGRQFIRDGENGFLVPLGDAGAFKAAAAGLMDRRTDWPAVRKAARETAEGYPWHRTIDQFESLLLRAGKDLPDSSGSGLPCLRGAE